MHSGQSHSSLSTYPHLYIKVPSLQEACKKWRRPFFATSIEGAALWRLQTVSVPSKIIQSEKNMMEGGVLWEINYF